MNMFILFVIFCIVLGGMNEHGVFRPTAPNDIDYL